jgi:hypothetical protein
MGDRRWGMGKGLGMRMENGEWGRESGMEVGTPLLNIRAKSS